MVLFKLNQGVRLERVAHCPVDVYEVLLQTWAANAGDRPSFTMLLASVHAYFETLLNSEPIRRDVGQTLATAVATNNENYGVKSSRFYLRSRGPEDQNEYDAYSRSGSDASSLRNPGDYTAARSAATPYETERQAGNAAPHPASADSYGRPLTSPYASSQAKHKPVAGNSAPHPAIADGYGRPGRQKGAAQNALDNPNYVPQRQSKTQHALSSVDNPIYRSAGHQKTPDPTPDHPNHQRKPHSHQSGLSAAGMKPPPSNHVRGPNREAQGHEEEHNPFRRKPSVYLGFDASHKTEDC